MATQNLALTPQNLFEVLQAATSSNPSHVQLASRQLQKWETTSGYWSLLQDAYFDTSLPRDVRWISIITLKYGVERYWRKNANNSIPKEEKDKIRSRLLDSVDEEDALLALQNAVIVGKIGRNEYPLDWPDIFTKLLQLIRSSTPQTNDPSQHTPQALRRLNRALTIVLHVVKELCSGRLPRIRSNLQTASPELFRVLAGEYVKFVDMWQPAVRSPQAADEIVLDQLRISVLCLKITRRLIVSGFEFANRAEEVQQFWSILNNQWMQFIQLVTSNALPLPTLKPLSKHVTSFGKLYLDLSRSQPAAFGLMEGVLTLMDNYWQVIEKYGDVLASGARQTLNRGTKKSTNGDGAAGDGSLEDFTNGVLEKIALQGMLLYYNCIKSVYQPTQTFKYRHKQEKEEVNTVTESFKTQLLVPEKVTRCVEVLVTKFFVLRHSDLQSWEEDPETWAVTWDDLSDSWEYMIRPCAEKLFMNLAVNHKSVIVQPLINVFQTVATTNSHDVLYKDSVYTAVGLAACILDKDLDFDGFLNSTLVNEVQVSQPGYNILRRRIAILISQWTPVKLSQDNRPTVYRVMQHLMNKEDPLNDLVVRVTAARSLRACVDEWEFRVEQFMPFVADIFQKIMALIDEVEETETKMSLLNVIACIVERLGNHVAPYADQIVQILPPLWEQTGEEHLFKQAILSVLAKLVTAMKEDSLKYNHMVIPLLQYSVDPRNGLQVYLLEDSLDLWDATIKATPSANAQEILKLVEYIFPCMETDTLTLHRVLEVIEGYVLLAPREMLQYTPQIFHKFSSLMGQELKSEASRIITHVVEMVIRAGSGVGGDALNIIGKALVDSNYIIKIFEGVYGTWQAHQTTGPNKKYPPIETAVLTDYVEVLSRLVLADTPIFMEIVGYVGSTKLGGESVEATMKWLLEEWFNHFANIGHPRIRKLNCLALTKLLETNEKWILGKIQDLMTVWTDVVVELTEDSGDDSLIYWTNEEPQDGTSSAEEARRRELTHTDPVHSINVREFIKHHLLQAQERNGGPQQLKHDWVDSVDGEVLADFMKLNIFT